LADHSNITPVSGSGPSEHWRKEFSRQTILVLGDLIQDHYIYGEVERISPEAPVPVIRAEREEFTPGGAANVVTNLRAFDCRVLVAGRLGRDAAGEQLQHAFTTGYGVNPDDLLLMHTHQETIRKTRLIGNNQQICRLDWEDTSPAAFDIEEAYIQRLQDRLPEVDAVIVSDYGKGLITANLMEALRSSKVPIIAVDPYTGHYDLYEKVTFLTPNHHEAGAGSGIRITDQASLLESGHKLFEMIDPDFLVITRGKDGMSLFQKDQAVRHLPTVAREVFDVTGAGDTVISVLTLAHSAGMALPDCCRLANAAGGQVVGHMGAVAVDADELLLGFRPS
jgi:rfaE bifunctional protein kinase chain/domain